MTVDKLDLRTNSNMSSAFDPFWCKLCITVPKGKRKLLKKILYPLTKWIDPSFEFFNIFESDIQHRNDDKLSRTSEQCEVECVKAPSISVMLFLSENGAMSSKDVQKLFLLPPWAYHHKVELYNVRSPERTAACQEFYEIADDMPLWSVCPVHYGNEHLRVLIYVRNFQKMVEFYRVITDSEMESSKPGFCIFQMCSQPGLDIQVALKYSKYIEPYPISTTHLSFKVKNVESIRAFTGCNLETVEGSSFIATDPDGNKVLLYQISNANTSIPTKSVKNRSEKFSEDIKSCRSSDSHDSGRCSDSEIWCSEPEPFRNESLGLNSRTEHVLQIREYCCMPPALNTKNKIKAVYL